MPHRYWISLPGVARGTGRPGWVIWMRTRIIKKMSERQFQSCDRSTRGPACRYEVWTIWNIRPTLRACSHSNAIARRCGKPGGNPKSSRIKSANERRRLQLLRRVLWPKIVYFPPNDTGSVSLIIAVPNGFGVVPSRNHFIGLSVNVGCVRINVNSWTAVAAVHTQFVLEKIQNVNVQCRARLRENWTRSTMNPSHRFKYTA
jgi:hypothetical protein